MPGYRSVAIRAARAGGKILKRRFNTELDVRAKDAHDIVTDADIESERAIIKIIKGQFPEHAVRAEESGQDYKKSEYLWLIDPLDGTFQFKIGNPYFSVSIALAHKNRVILGVVFNPILNQLYYAEKGRGAYLNGRRIKVSGEKSMRNAIIGTLFLYRPRYMKRHSAAVKRLVLSTRKVIDIASPAMNLCNIARGRIDGLVDYGATPEDHSAGSIIVREAGGRVDSYGRTGYDFTLRGIIASNGLLHRAILRTVGKD